MWARVTFNKWFDLTEITLRLLDVFTEGKQFCVALKTAVRVADFDIKDESCLE